MKISRERVGIEIEKMLQGMLGTGNVWPCRSQSAGPNPHMALSLIYSLTLFDAIFTPPINDVPDLPTAHMSIATSIVQHILSSSDSTKYANIRTLAEDKMDQYILWLLASLSPWKGHVFPGVDTRKNIPAAATAAREGLKMMTKIYNTIVSSYRNYSRIQDTVQTDATAQKLARGKAGMFIRKLGADWKSQYLCAMILEAIPLWNEGDATPTPEAEKVLEKYGAFLAQIRDQGLEEAHAFKPILNVSINVIR
jgi:tRNA nucleotidyltransferase (CCA-adding enzyme)